MTSSEEVLLVVKHVKQKKCEGALYMMSERMAWMQPSRDTFTISHSYADVRVQKISPDSKERVQLQVVLHNNSANTFHFCNPLGREAQVKDREGVKEILQQLLPKFRNKVNSELEEKNRMLQEDPELFQLYKDLVVSGVVTSDEFWANRKSNQGNNYTNSQQEVGISAAFLSDIKPQTDGCNGHRYNLTTDIIQSIFRTYPAVRKKYIEAVPDKVTEQEFWTRFFQSHYFHRDRINFNNKDLFADCAKTDEQDLQEEIQRPVEDPLMDLQKMDDKSLGEGYGLEREPASTSANPTNASLIKRFNHHSSMVLKACDKQSSSSDRQQSEPSSSNAMSLTSHNGHTSLNDTGQPNHDSQQPPRKKIRLREKTDYEDLELKVNSPSGSTLRLSCMDRYLHGPTPVNMTQYHTSEDAIESCQAVAHEMMAWNPQLTQVLHSTSAVSVLGELSPGGALMYGHSRQLHQMLPEDIMQELSQMYKALCELLRHFWACFPASTKFLEEKVMRMQSNLERFQQAKLNPVREKLKNYSYSLNLVGHMEEMLQAAYVRFQSWQTKRLAKRS